MKEAVMRLGPWQVERMLGRDLSGSYHAARRDDGARATLYLPSGNLAPDRCELLTRLLERHRAIAHRGLVCFRGIAYDSDEPFLIADAVDDAMMSLLRGRRPAPGQTCAVAAALAGSLVAAHDGGLVHGGLELDNVLWAPDHAPRILGAGLAGPGGTDRVASVQGDVVGFGRLLCALVASWPPLGAGAAWSTADSRTIELVRLIADPGAVSSMREAHALLAAGEPRLFARGRGTIAEPPTVVGRGPRVPDHGEPRAGVTIGTAKTAEYPPEGIDVDGVRVGASPDAKPDQPGGQLGRYRILTRLGCGGMGEVFLAEDPALRRGVAIKRIRPGLERDRTFRARLRREAQLAAHLSHRAVVQVFDLITDEAGDHVVMEYVPGPSLHALLAGSRMPVAEVLRIAVELADGLAYAHQQGIVHRDLKLENILISIDGQPKIADFGIARRTAPATSGDRAGHESLTHDGIVIGTSRAMSPEQIRGHDVDARSDLFSFGVMLYELVTGTSPFATEVAAMTMLRVLNERQAPARDLAPEVPRALSDLIDHLLEKSPAQRLDSARALRDRLRRILDGDVQPLGAAAHRGASEVARARPAMPPAGASSAHRFAGTTLAASGSGEHHRPLLARDREMADLPGIGNYPAVRRSSSSRIQAPFVLAEIRALRASIFKKSPEIRSALAIADRIEHSYDLRRADLFIPALDTFCAILEPFAMTVLTGTLRRIGYEIFPQYVSILGIPQPDVKAAMDLKSGADLVRFICDAYSKCVVGADAGTLESTIAGSTVTVTDTTFMPCQLQMGVFLGAGKLTGLFRDTALTEKRCRARGDGVCAYDFVF